MLPRQSRERHKLKWLWFAAATIALAGCAAGPAHRAPALSELHVPPSWSAERPAYHGRVEDLSKWWQQLSDTTLAGLIEQALKNGPDLRSARARLREARARRDLAGANRFPTVTASLSAGRSKSSSETGTGATHSFFSAGFDASWEPDVFGGTTRALEAAEADLEASQASFHATQVSLAAEVALNYVEVRAFQARLAIARDNLAAQSETLQLTEWRAQAGLTSSLDVEQARANRDQTRAQIPLLETGLAEAEHRLAILLGLAPGALHRKLAARAPIPAVPERIAAGIPADVMRQRPDVRAAERKLAAETARVGQAAAALYPSFTLNGSIGLEALTLGALTGGGAVTRSLLVGMFAPIFDAGRIRSQITIQGAIQEQALASYETIVLTALEDVENALVSLAYSRERQAALASAVEAARNAVLLARHRYATGITDFQKVLDTERTLLSLEDALAATRAEDASALVRLYKALGGGWSPTPSTGAGRADEDPS